MKCEEVATVFVVDDDRDMRESLKWLLESAGFKVELYDSAEHFLERPGQCRWSCMLLDVRMRGLNGLGLLERLNDQGATLPVIMFTGHGDISMAVTALKAGAFDFIEKPATHQLILERVRLALALNEQIQEREQERGRVKGLLAQLSEREAQVLEHLIQGSSNKLMATELGISERTVEKHREGLMQKMGTRSLAALIRMVVLNQIEEEQSQRALRTFTH